MSILSYGPKRSVIAITGGRYTEDRKPLIPSEHQLSEFFKLYAALGFPLLVHGAAIGTDRSVALACAAHFGTQCSQRAYPVTPSLDGPFPLAGHKRNRRMLRDSKAEALAAFPGGSGTANCVSEALAMGIDLWEWKGDRETGQFVHKKVDH